MQNNMPPLKSKESLRAYCRSLRASLSPSVRLKASQAITARFRSKFTFNSADYVGGYYAIQDEVPTKELYETLWEKDIKLALPVVQPSLLAPLLFFPYEPNTQLIKTDLSLYEPKGEEQDVIPNYLIVPLIAFDERGHRLGYGKGYYDRTISALKKCRQNLVTIGLAFECQRIAEVPVEPHDQPLDHIITESTIIDRG